MISDDGAIAQLGERYNGIVEVRGSIPRGSTNEINELHSFIGTCSECGVRMECTRLSHPASKPTNGRRRTMSEPTQPD